MRKLSSALSLDSCSRVLEFRLSRSGECVSGYQVAMTFFTGAVNESHPYINNIVCGTCTHETNLCIGITHVIYVHCKSRVIIAIYLHAETCGVSCMYNACVKL